MGLITEIKIVLAVLFTCMNVSIIALALLPTSTIVFAEIVAAAVATLSIILVAIGVFVKPCPYALRKGYLLTGLNSLYVLIGFLATSTLGANINIPIAMMLTTYIIISYGIDAIVGDREFDKRIRLW